LSHRRHPVKIGRINRLGDLVAATTGPVHTEVVPFAASLYVVGPLIAFGVVAALAAVLRWAFDGDVATAHFTRLAAEDYGLLSVVGVADSLAEARMLQSRLATADIRATTAVAPDGTVRVLVFTTELEKARRLVGPS
jgi:hypothetical protein